MSFLRVYHGRTVSARDSTTHRRLRKCVTVELSVPSSEHAPRGGSRLENIRSPLAVRSSDHFMPMRGYPHSAGEFEGEMIVRRSAEKIAPHIEVIVSDIYEPLATDALLPKERDGFVRRISSREHQDCDI